MSLRLKRPGTDPHELMIKTTGLQIGTAEEHTEIVIIGDYDIAMADFLDAALYVLTNSDLQPNDDLRLQFVELVKSMDQIPGYDKSRMRLHYNQTFATAEEGG